MTQLTPGLNDLVAVMEYIATELRPNRGWKGSGAALFSMAVRAHPTSSEPWVNDITTFLPHVERNAELSAALQQRNVAVWRGADDQFRLVNLAPPRADQHQEAAAMVAAGRRGAGCAFCGIKDEPSDEVTYRPTYVANLHERCQSAWGEWSALARKQVSQGAKPATLGAPLKT